MSNLFIKGVPEEVLRGIKASAALEGMTIKAWVIGRLQTGGSDEPGAEKNGASDPVARPAEAKKVEAGAHEARAESQPRMSPEKAEKPERNSDYLRKLRGL